MKWVLILLFVHADGTHSLAVDFDDQVKCERAAAQWRASEQYRRIRQIVAQCHQR